MTRRPLALLVGLVALVLFVAIPVLAASPSPTPAKGDQPGREKAEETQVTLSGTVVTATDTDGEVTYSLTSGGTRYTLEAGPPWFFGDAYPLKPYVGKSVTIVGELAMGSNEVDVQSVDGTALRARGKPPWAGGWKAVGSRHPGWSQEKADRFKAKFGDCFPPGHCKAKPEVKASEAP